MMSRLLSAAAIGSALLGAVLMSDHATAQSTDAAIFTAPETAWRTVDPENMLLIQTKYGNIAVELFPEIAPKHVAQVKALARSGFYDNVPFHRVIAGFMNQTGDGTNGDGTGDSTLPDLEAEFTFRRGANMPFAKVTTQKAGPGQIGVGFYKSLQIASQPTAQAMFTKDNKVNAFGLHCPGVTSMARTSDPNSANSQFFLMRGKADHLDTEYSIWGTTVMGRDLLEKPVVGAVGDSNEWMPDYMDEVDVVADLEGGDRPTVQVLKTDSSAFTNWVEMQKEADGTYPDICELSVPTRVL